MSQRLQRVLPSLVLLILVAASFALELPHLGHKRLTTFDESFHAVVARNLLLHPLHPTLYEQPAMPYDPAYWAGNHTWLHKGTLPLWVIAFCYKCLGITTFALRIASAILAAGCVLLTYAIGKKLLDQTAALIAAAIHVVLPALPFLAHGYLFSDHIDVLLLFLIEAAALFLVRAIRNGSWLDAILAGAMQGLAFLTKSYLAAIITGLAVTAWLLPLLRLAARDQFRLKGRHLLGLIGATLLVALPWTMYCYLNYRTEFLLENGLVFRHLSDSVERWGAPWQQVIFIYLPELYFAFLGPLLVAAIILLPRAFIKRDGRLLLLIAWIIGVMTPHLLAQSKTPSATLIALPAFVLLLAWLVAESFRGQRWALAIWLGGVLVAVLHRPVFRWHAALDPNPVGMLGYLRYAPWVLTNVAGGLVLALASYVVLISGARNEDPLAISGARKSGNAAVSDAQDDTPDPISGARNEDPLAISGARNAPAGSISGARNGSPGRTSLAQWTFRMAIFLACVATLDLMRQDIRICHNITTRPDRDDRALAQLAGACQSLPADAVILVDSPDEGEHLQLMFLTGRTCYPLDEIAYAIDAKEADRTLAAMQTAAKQGQLTQFLAQRAPQSLLARPAFLVSAQSLPIEPLQHCESDGKYLYRLR